MFFYVSLGHVCDLLPADFLPPWLTQAPPASVGAIQYNNIKFELQFSELPWQITHSTKFNSLVRKHTNSLAEHTAAITFSSPTDVK